MGIKTDGMCKGLASKVIDNLINRRNQKLATVKQVMALERFGYQNVANWTFDQASKKMNELAAVGWKPWRLRVRPEEFAWI